MSGMTWGNRVPPHEARRALVLCRRSLKLWFVSCRSTLHCHAWTTFDLSPPPSPSMGEGGGAEAQAVNFLTWRQNSDAFRCRPTWHRGEDEVRVVLAAR